VPVVDGNWVCPDKAFTFPPGCLPATVGGMRGPAWRKWELEKFTNTPLMQLTLTKGMAMDVERAAVETNGAAEEALNSLKVAMDKFKSTLANDLTSIKAAGSRVQSEALQMKQAYQAAQAMLTTAEFERAVANAERMAAALKAISELSETKLSVAVFSGGAAREG
jgi:predicted phage tail protein